jgi:hypothetical protein
MIGDHIRLNDLDVLRGLDQRDAAFGGFAVRTPVTSTVSTGPALASTIGAGISAAPSAAMPDPVVPATARQAIDPVIISVRKSVTPASFAEISALLILRVIINTNQDGRDLLQKGELQG